MKIVTAVWEINKEIVCQTLKGILAKESLSRFCLIHTTSSWDVVAKIFTLMIMSNLWQQPLNFLAVLVLFFSAMGI